MHYLDSVVLVLLAAVLAVIICRRLNVPPMLGYLMTGFVAGSLKFLPQTPATDFLGEIGIVFLMFTIGLEFSLGKLRAMKSMVFGLGSMQVVLTLLVLMAMGWALEIRLEGMLALAGALTLSSTAIVSRMMSERAELGQPHGQMVMGVLLMQDIAVVPIMILLHSLAGDGSSLWRDLSLALVKMVVVLVVLLYLGDKLMRPWFRLVAQQQISELFMLNVLFVTLGVSYLTELAGLSLAFGAFVAGMLIAETQYRFQVEDDIRPFRDAFLGFFFVTVGMRLEVSVLLNNINSVLVFLTILIVLKALIVFAIGIVRKHGKKNSFRAALYLAQGSEFGFVLFALASKENVIHQETVQIGTAAILLSMIAAPFLIKYADQLSDRLFKSGWDEKALDLHGMLVENMGKSDHVIIVGFGNVGQTVARLLQKHNITYYVLDLDAERVHSARLAGEPAVYGDASRKEILIAAGVKRARMVVVTSSVYKETEHVLAAVMNVCPNLSVVVRSRADSNIEHLMEEMGAEEVISDEREIGLALAGETMLNCGMPLAHVYDEIHQVRQDKYRVLKGVFLESGKFGDAQERQQVCRESLQLCTGAYALGKRIDEIPFEKKRVELVGVRRGRRHISEYPADFVLQENDVLIVVGLPAEIREIEEFVLAGTDV